MAEPPSVAGRGAKSDPSDHFSLVAGGPFQAFCVRLGLSSPELSYVGRRAALLAAVAWLPLLVLTLVDGSFRSGAVAVPFAFDFDVHLRLLVALPLLLAAELPIHDRLSKAVRQFLTRGLVLPERRQQFEAAVASTLRARDAWAGELVVLAFVFIVARAFWLEHLSVGAASWFASAASSGGALTLPGRWLAWVSVPLYQFLVYRWLYRLVLWIALLVRLARTELHLLPTHPDRAGGLGFLGNASLGFSTLMVAQGVLLAGMIANFIFFDGAKLTDYKLEVGGLVVVLVVLILGPLAAFAPTMIRVRRLGLSEYGLLAQRYVRGFDAKWLRGGGGEEADLMGSADIQSLADLTNSYEVVKTMRSVPFGRDTALKLAAAIVVPILPLTLTMIPLEELIDRLIGALL